MLKSINLFRYTGLLQGVYYVISGVWPLLHIDSFQMITGPKEDVWLVTTFGLVLAAFGAVMLFVYFSKNNYTVPGLFGLAVAATLCAADVWHVASGTISVVYLIDAALQLLIVLGWLLGYYLTSRNRGRANG